MLARTIPYPVPDAGWLAPRGDERAAAGKAGGGEGEGGGGGDGDDETPAWRVWAGLGMSLVYVAALANAALWTAEDAATALKLSKVVLNDSFDEAPNESLSLGRGTWERRGGVTARRRDRGNPNQRRRNRGILPRGTTLRARRRAVALSSLRRRALRGGG